jgi:hypothetical protein
MIEEKFFQISDSLGKQLRNDLEDSLTFQLKSLEAKLEEQLQLREA